MHLYESTCNLAQDAGAEGLVAMRDGLNELKREQVNISASNVKSQNGGMASLPETNERKVDRRIQSRCSPRKK